MNVSYPIKIAAAIQSISVEYGRLVTDLCSALAAGVPLAREKQDESAATYSLWRDEDDYRIDWTRDAAYIKRFIDSVGHPYKGAASSLSGRRIRILDAETEPDLRFEERHPGKIFLLRRGEPLVVCGKGILRITDMRDDESGATLMPVQKMRQRFL